MKVWFSAVVMGVFASASLAADQPLAWPQFRGPGGAGVAEGQKPPTELGPDKNLKWKVPVPSGFSSPIVVGDKLVMTAFDGGKLYTVAYSRANGKEAWRREAPAKQIEKYHLTEGSPAASTPATDGERIVSYFGSCGLFCYDADGKELWTFELPMAVTAFDFGTGNSPIIADGAVILARDETKDPKIVVLDIASGKVKWEKKRPTHTSYSTPIVSDTPDGKQIVVAGFGRLVAYDLQSGAEKWSVSGMPAACCSSPVAVKGTVYYAGWSPGDPNDKEFQMPRFDELLKQGDANSDGAVSREESEKTFLKGFFDNNDTDKDGTLTRKEWDDALKIMAMSRNSAFAVKAGGSGDITSTHVLWKKTRGLPYVPSAIAYLDQYVMIKDGGMVTSYDAKTGKEVYVQKRVAATGRYYASPVAANGHIYFVSLDDGAVTVLKAGASSAEVVTKNPPLGERVAATPAIADNTLYVRGASHLYAFGEK